MTTENTNTEERTHSSRSMSKWCAVIDCQCFESKEYTQTAQKGTDTHALLAGWLTTYKETGKLPDMPSDLDFVEQGAYRVAEKVAARLRDSNVSPKALCIEQRVHIAETDIYGFVDILWESAVGVSIVDFKTFYNPSRDYTAQLAGYGYAYATEHNLPDNTNVMLEVMYGDNNNGSILCTTVARCKEIYEQAMAAFDVRDAGTAEPKQCAWCELCKHSATCPAYKAIATTVAQEPRLKNAPEAWSELPVAHKAQLLVLAETVTKWADQVREKAKEDLLNGAVIEDVDNAIKYGLRHTKGRKIPRTEDACRMLKENGATDAELRSVLKLGATECKAILKEHGIKGKKADELIDNICDFTSPSAVMVRM